MQLCAAIQTYQSLCSPAPHLSPSLVESIFSPRPCPVKGNPFVHTLERLSFANRERSKCLNFQLHALGPLIGFPDAPCHAVAVAFLKNAFFDLKAVSVHQGIVRALAGDRATMGIFRRNGLCRTDPSDVWGLNFSSAAGKKSSGSDKKEQPNHLSVRRPARKSR